MYLTFFADIFRRKLSICNWKKNIGFDKFALETKKINNGMNIHWNNVSIYDRPVEKPKIREYVTATASN